MSHRHSAEVAAGQRFEFGKNWKQFLALLSAERILIAEESLREMLQRDQLSQMRFLDVGSGSGLFSLAARRLGAEVHSFDYDPESVACTAEVRRRFFPDDEGWIVEEGSVLDEVYMASLGRFDVVYSWGVLHHTGDMWRAMVNAAVPVGTDGLLFISIYNDRGPISSFWRQVKKLYCSGLWGRAVTRAVFIPYFALLYAVIGVVKYKNPFKFFSEYKKNRGQSSFTDWIDWLGGYPFEVAKPEEVFDFYSRRGFVLRKMKTDSGTGCNQFVFQRTD